MNHMTHIMIPTDISIFHQNSANFVISQNTNINYILVHNF